MPWDEAGDEGQDFGDENELGPGRYHVKVDEVSFFESKKEQTWGKVSFYDAASGGSATLMILCEGSTVSAASKGIWRRNFYRVMKCIPFPNKEYWECPKEERPNHTWDRSDLNRAEGKMLLIEVGQWTDDRGRTRNSIDRIVPSHSKSEAEIKEWCGEQPPTPLASSADPDVPF